ncbi:MAG: transglycosylase SLT domain-containing protein [Oculatellaceae cyanobacterium Prado106]|jgi:soluble lytic murein transglycosylase|nr:transglycosylase SLT domain-containing protein [Oculatellaceae cyanobacterium Prado106]
MLKQKKQVLWTGVGVTALTLSVVTIGLATTGLGSRLPLVGQWLQSEPKTVETEPNTADQKSQTLALASLPAAQRMPTLESLSKSGADLDRHRARYLLASDLIDQGKAGSALPLLDRLEADYPVLAPQILAKRSQAHTAMGNTAKAEATWQELIQKYPTSPAIVEGLFVLGKKNPQYWEQAIAQFPAHPRTLEIIQTRLKQNPKQPQLLLILVKHALWSPDIVSVMDRLKTEYAAQLKPEDWEAIAFGYWEKQEYGKAAEAYAKAPGTPLTRYRVGRGAHLEGRTNAAVAGYKTVIQAYPDSEEAGMALLRLADLNSVPENAIPYLDQVIQRFPDKAAEALVAKAEILQQINSPKSASQARQLVLSQYSNSEAAAEMRWQQAEANAKKGDIRSAWEWARQLAQENPDSTHAAEAAFWVGKWAGQLKRPQDAQESFRYVIANYPESYYAWRSAVYLGWNVGDFTTVRQKLPQIVDPIQRPVPPAGSEALKELYQLGRDREAWTLWQVEFANRQQPTVAQQFTDGLMRLGVNDNLEAIFMISSLTWREKPEERTEYKQLKEQPAYWHALYPFPFESTIAQWSQQRQLNPLLVTGLIRQESRFEANIRSVADAVGLMQIIPETAAYVAEQNNVKQYNLSDPNDNVKLGTWYLDYTHREYDNNSLFAVASYNAGPGAIADWIKRYSFSDPDQFIEQIPYPETKGYVTSVFENYWNYLRLYNPEVSQQLAQLSPKHAKLVQPR